MTSYTKTTDFLSKDALATGNPAKKVKGSEIDTEFENLELADADNLKISVAAVGTWTPALTSSGATFSYAVQTGYYAVTGNIVDCYGYIALDSAGNTVTAQPMYIQNLPVTAKDLTNMALMAASSSVIISGFATAPTDICMSVAENTTQATFLRQNGVNHTAMFSNYLQDSSAMYFHIRYLK